MPPFPAMRSLRIPITVHAVPSPRIILLSPAFWAPLMIVVEILLRKYPTMMFRERVAGIDTVLTVVANAGTILSVAGPG